MNRECGQQRHDGLLEWKRRTQNPMKVVFNVFSEKDETIYARIFESYREFLDRCNAMRGGNVLFLELGVGMNTPGIIKYPFWQMTALNLNATYACINYGQAYAPDDIGPRSLCIDGDIGEVVAKLL